MTYDELIDGARAALEPPELEETDAGAAEDDSWSLPAGVDPWEGGSPADTWDDTDPF